MQCASGLHYLCSKGAIQAHACTPLLSGILSSDLVVHKQSVRLFCGSALQHQLSEESSASASMTATLLILSSSSLNFIIREPLATFPSLGIELKGNRMICALFVLSNKSPSSSTYKDSNVAKICPFHTDCRFTTTITGPDIYTVQIQNPIVALPFVIVMVFFAASLTECSQISKLKIQRCNNQNLQPVHSFGTTASAILQCKFDG